jgi:hypothetical protein
MKASFIMKFWKLGKPVSAFVLAAGTVIAPVGMSQAQAIPATAAPAALSAKAGAAGATHIRVRQRSDGRILLHGRLKGRNFVIDNTLGIQKGAYRQAALTGKRRGCFAEGSERLLTACRV